MTWTGLFQNTLSAWQWALLAAIPPLIVLLYFLKLKRQPIEAPSTYLWSRTIEDLHVNSIWQRLRQNLLLFLQLLLLALAMLAALRPGWRGQELVGDRFVFLIDTSASMSARDLTPTRLDEARRLAAELIQQMKTGDVAMIISFSNVARVEQSFTDNRAQLLARLRAIEPTQRTSDLSEALRAAAGLANPGSTGTDPTRDQILADALPATLYLFSDGGFAAVPDFFLGNLEPRYTPLGRADVANLAITAFSAERHPDKPDKLSVYGRVENFGPEEVTTEIELLRDGVLLDASRITAPAGGSTGVEFELSAQTTGVLTLKIDRDDALPLDNVAYAAINTTRQARILLITPKNDALQLALATDAAAQAAQVEIKSPDVLAAADAADAALTEAQRTHEALAAAGLYDLIIYDQCAPRVAPQANTLTIGRAPPGDAWTTGERQPAPQVIDVDRTHPLMQFINFDNVRIAEGFAAKPPPGGRTLVDSDVGPLAAIGPREGFEDVVLGFEIVGRDAAGALVANTDWPIRLSFPLFVKNVVEYLGGGGVSLAAESIRPGEPIALRTETPVDRVTVTSPSGQPTIVLREGQNTFVYTGALTTGVYEVREGERREGPVAQRFAVNLFDPRESDLQPRPELDLGGAKVVGSTTWQPARKELWKWLLLAALGVLVVEWWVYNKRVYV